MKKLNPALLKLSTNLNEEKENKSRNYSKSVFVEERVHLRARLEPIAMSTCLLLSGMVYFCLFSRLNCNRAH